MTQLPPVDPTAAIKPIATTPPTTTTPTTLATDTTTTTTTPVAGDVAQLQHLVPALMNDIGKLTADLAGIRSRLLTLASQVGNTASTMTTQHGVLTEKWLGPTAVEKLGRLEGLTRELGSGGTPGTVIHVIQDLATT